MCLKKLMKVVEVFIFKTCSSCSSCCVQVATQVIKCDPTRSIHFQAPQVPQEGFGRQVPPLNPNPPFQAPLNQRPQNPIPPNQVQNAQDWASPFEGYGREEYEGYGAFDDAYMREEEIRGGRGDTEGMEKGETDTKREM